VRYRILFFAAAFTILATLGSHASFQDPANTSDKPLYQPYGNEPRLVGTISIIGKFPRPKLIDMGADPVCIKLNKTRRTQWIEASQGKLRNAFVYVKEGDPLKMYRFEVPDSEVVLEHKACRYSPHVLGLRVGQRLSLVNSDPIVHKHPSHSKIEPGMEHVTRGWQSTVAQNLRSPGTVDTLQR